MAGMKIVLVGAGSAMFTRGLVADLLRRGGELELALVDPNPEALSAVEKLVAKMIAARKAPVKLSASARLRDVLAGATVVICTVGVGGRRAWERDVYIPRNHGIYQPVGDTVGPGGTSRVLRMVPAMVEVAKAVLDICPQALFFNYGNPMSATCRGIVKATGAPVVGLCHGVPDTARFLAWKLGALEPDRTSPRFDYTAVGINHCTWYTRLTVDGKDAIPDLMEVGRKILARYASADAPFDGDDPEGHSRFSWRLALLFGLFPGVGDRHVSEFFPRLSLAKGQYFGKTLGLEAFSFEGTIAGGDKIYEEMKEIAFAGGPLPADYFDSIGGEHEQVVEIIDAIRGDTGQVYSVNLPNQGQVPGLLPDAVIECPARATRDGLKPVPQPALPAGIAGMLNARFAWAEATVEAALEGSRDKFVQALLLDGAVDSLTTAGKLADELLEAQAEYLPLFNGVGQGR
jgi:alpha-galactosidase